MRDYQVFKWRNTSNTETAPLYWQRDAFNICFVQLDINRSIAPEW